MEVTDRFVDLVRRDRFPLDEAALLIGAHGDPACDVSRGLGQLDELAARVGSASLGDLLGTVFGTAGFHGDQPNYYDPRNSYLHTVLDRRRGIPISLSVVLMEVGRRVGVPLEGISTPVHFLTRTTTAPARYIDAFAGGQVLDRSDLDGLFDTLAPGVDIDAHLEPVSDHDIVRRMLGNLVGAHQRRGDRRGLLWSARLRSLVPGASRDDLRTYAGALAATGEFGAAAGVLDALVADGSVEDAAAEAAAADRLRSSNLHRAGGRR